MAQKYYTSAETAKLLGKSVDEVKKMLERRELHGYRDGADWKFKVEDIDKLAKQSPAAPVEEEGGDVLLSEVELGQSDPGLSGTVIGMNGGGQPAAESDIRLAESDLLLSDSQATSAKLGDSAAAKTPPPRKPAVDSTSKTPLPKKPAVDSTSKTPLPKKKSGDSTQFEELDLTLEEDLTLEDSSLLLEGKTAGSSVIDLGASDKSLDDDDLVLGGSGGGKGSSLAIGGDSGISLIDPSDSGLSLETPLNLSPAAEESLELGEADLLAGDSSPKVKADEEFLLTPLEEVGDAADSESGSQVIALDTEGENSAIGSSAGVSMAAMLDEDLSTQPALGIGATAPLGGMPVLGAQPAGLSEGAALASPSAVLLEAPYTTWQIVSLVLCALLLMLCGMMMFDLLRNMWSWSGIYSLNSSLMDTILGWIG